MAFRVPGPQHSSGGRQVAMPRWPRFVIPIVIIIVAAAILISVTAGIWTDYLWYSSIGKTRVFATTYSTKWLLFVITAIFMMAVIGANIVIAYRSRPEEPPTGPEHQGVEAYRQAIDPHRRGVAIVLLGLTGLISGLTAASNWQTWLLFINRVPFRLKDPQFHLDVSFFVNVYPFLRLLLSYLFAAVLISLVLSVGVHVLYGGLTIARHAQPSRAARAHLFILIGIFVALKAIAYWLDRYGIDFSQRGVVETGASYTDVHAVLPAKTVLAAIAVICAVLFLAGALRRSAMLAAMGFGLLVLSAVVIGGVYPLIIQQFVVKPNEAVKERPFIAREIANTRTAYGVSNVQVSPYSAISTEKLGALATDAAGLPDLRLLDPDVISGSYQQLQQIKGYYKFADVLAMDRYVLGSNPVAQDQVVGVRGLSGPPAGQSNWINTHLIYTHGYGFVSAPAGTAQPNGNPQFSESDVPPTGQLGNFQPRIYFGEAGADYVVANTKQAELDFPNESTGGQHNNHYNGGGGVSIGSLGRKLLFAVKFRELNILLSGAIENNSRILYIRNPLQRVQKVAPFLTLDGDPYPVAEDGQIVWVVDGYTATNNYPYSRRINLEQATSNTYSPNGLANGPNSGEVNYLRNSVKVTVNAYTGVVHLYQWGKPSPILTTWMKAFPGLIQPQSQIPRLLMPHLRYPEVMFDAQRLILTQFHVQQASSFYGGQNFWQVPNDPIAPPHVTIAQPPYYFTLDMPGAPTPEFSMVSSFTPRSRANLAAYIAVNSNPLSTDYGKIQILQLPQDTAVTGPEQIQSNFENDPPAAEPLSLLRQQGSKVTEGNLITVPLGGGLLSVEPVYVSASSETNSGSYPQMKKVFTYWNGTVGFADTLAQSLAQAFGTAPQPSSGPAPPGSPGQVNAAVLAFLAQAEKFYNEAQQALHSNPPNFTLYGQDIAKMKAALDHAQQAAQASPSSPGRSSPSPGPSSPPSPGRSSPSPGPSSPPSPGPSSPPSPGRSSPSPGPSSPPSPGPSSPPSPGPSSPPSP
ncbi:MAG TPA: UPF0182 family protein, partial [Streptosporangiaceae bacterium]|nr:UPF0182 family protein [Streptosporangiaceae bacterium]